ncbi:MAG: SsrA-binding protein SmpB [Candidatus Dojkabacteria bacterium]|nr:SsrA-binding protein SmpB [Candidatus Dojkabacteria bacterium]MDD4561227.1 SsrA-binding protein SmpB [Candidatus Dojkabacteria bacterium]
MRIKNKKASFNYEISDAFEAGIVLAGAEVKSIKSGRVNLSDAFVKIVGGELWLVNADIPRYKSDGSLEYDSKRSRKLLVKRKELVKIDSKLKQKNLTLIPLSVYTSRGKIKVEVAFGKGRKKHEKKAREKERELDRELLYEKREYMV